MPTPCPPYTTANRDLLICPWKDKTDFYFLLCKMMTNSLICKVISNGPQQSSIRCHISWTLWTEYSLGNYTGFAKIMVFSSLCGYKLYIFFFYQFYFFFNLTFVFLFQRAPSVWVPWYIDLYNSTCYPEEGIQFHIPKLWRWNDNFPDTKLLSINPDEQGKKAGFNYIDLTEPILILSIFPCNINQTICGFEFY